MTGPRTNIESEQLQESIVNTDQMNRGSGAAALMRRQIDLATEQSIVAQCRKQDYSAFGRIVDAYQARVFGFVKRMVRQEEEALDITQEVFIKAFQGMSKFDGACSLRTWLFRIAYNLCIDRSRKAKRGLVELGIESFGLEDEPMEFADSRWNPEGLAMNQELEEAVDRAIDSMSEKLRIVLLMHDKEDMGYDEIAQAIDIPIGTVKSRLFLARSFLQRSLNEYVTQGERGA